jgi:NAD(P)-dependent dehydrogenase (short-subunit alcohol dehydrogenase family)
VDLVDNYIYKDTGGKNMSQEKVALVTGVSSGIGRAIAGLLSRHGFRVFGTTRGNGGAKRALENVELVHVDVRDEESVHSCVRTVLDRAGRIDALVNNAGYTLIGSLEETTTEEAKRLFETNFFGVLRMTQAVLRFMREQRSGRVANIGSLVGFVPAPYQGIYCASKHALEGYSESLDHEVRQFGIRVSVIEPGFTRTNIAQNSQIAGDPLDVYTEGRNRVLQAVAQNIAKGATPVGVAEVVLKALTSESPRSRYPVGREVKFVGRLRKFAPSSLFDRGLRKQFRLDPA